MFNRLLKTPERLITVISLSFGLLIGCAIMSAPPVTPVPSQPPAAPAAGVGITMRPPVVGVHITLGPTQCDTDDRGVAWCIPVPAGDYFVKVALPDDYDPDPGGTYTITPATCMNADGESSWPNCEITIAVTRKKPLIAPAVGRIVPDGELFRLNGQIWQWRGSTDFLLFRDFLEGGDLSDVLTQRHNAGVNVVRVLGMAYYIPVNANQPAFDPKNYPQYFDRLRAFVDYVATFGLRVEFTALADAQMLMPLVQDQDRYLSRVITNLPETAFLEICNEPFKNGCDVGHLLAALPASDVVVASGDYTWDLAIVGKYITVHEARDDEWPRKSRLDDWWEKYQRPTVWDEPMGADEINKPGSRSNVPDDFYDLCAGAALHGPGITFHSTAGILSQLWGPGQSAAAASCFAAMNAIPIDAPLWQYTRGGLADCPLDHDDAKALRTWCQITGGRAVCEAVRPQSTWAAVAVNGWHITNQTGPNGRLVFLER